MANVDSFLPLPSAIFRILMAVSAGDRHGYSIMQEVGLGPATLYRSLQRMLEQGLVLETAERPAADLDDERRRYYRITRLGENVARAETKRLTDLLRMARASGFAAAKA